MKTAGLRPRRRGRDFSQAHAGCRRSVREQRRVKLPAMSRLWQIEIVARRRRGPDFPQLALRYPASRCRSKQRSSAVLAPGSDRPARCQAYQRHRGSDPARVITSVIASTVPQREARDHDVGSCPAEGASRC